MVAICTRLIASCVFLLFTATAPDSETTPLSDALKSLDRQAQTVNDLTTDFVEEKYTALLKKPLVSKGRIFVKGSKTRWHTTSPRESTLFTDESRVAIYYPSRATMEVYPVDHRLRALMLSPVPRVATLQRHFDIKLVAKQSPKSLNLHLTPRDDSLREFIAELNVTVGTDVGLVRRIEMIDPEGDRTVITFENTQTNVGLSDKDVACHVPPETKIVHPLGTQDRSDSTPRSNEP